MSNRRKNLYKVVIQFNEFLDLDNYIVTKIRSIPMNLRIAAFSTILFSVLTHSYVFLNKFVNADSYRTFFPRELALIEGRWLSPFVESFRGVYAIPWLIGVYGTSLLVISCVLLVHMFEIESKINAFLIPFIITTFAAFAYAYMFDYIVVSHNLALLLSIYCVHLTNKYRYGWVPGAIVLMLSLALYQTFLAITMGLSVYFILNNILLHSNKIKQTLLYGYRFILLGGVGIAIYMGSFYLSRILVPDFPTRTAERITLGQVPITDLHTLVPKSIQNFFSFFMPSNTERVGIYPYNYTPDWLFYLYIIMFSLILVFIISVVIKRKIYRPINLLFIFLLLVSIPVSLNITNVTAPLVLLSPMRVSPFVLIMVYFIVFHEKYSETIASKKAKRVTKSLVLFSVTIIGLHNMQKSALVYFQHHVQYERTFAFHNRVLSRIEKTNGFHRDMPVAFVGTILASPHSYTGFNRSELTFDEVFTGYGGFFAGNSTATQIFTFIDSYLGVYLSRATDDQINRIRNTEEFTNMTAWPDFNSVGIVDGVLVVKLNYETFVDVRHLTGSTFLVKNAIPTIPDDYLFAWYIYRDDGATIQQIEVIWYTEGLSSFEFDFSDAGKYRFRMFVQRPDGTLYMNPVFSNWFSNLTAH